MFVAFERGAKYIYSIQCWIRPLKKELCSQSRRKLFHSSGCQTRWIVIRRIWSIFFSTPSFPIRYLSSLSKCETFQSIPHLIFFRELHLVSSALNTSILTWLGTVHICSLHNLSEGTCQQDKMKGLRREKLVFGIVLFAIPTVVFVIHGKLKVQDYPTPKNEIIRTAWIYDELNPEVAVRNILNVSKAFPENRVSVFCGTHQCLRKQDFDQNDRTQTELHTEKTPLPTTGSQCSGVRVSFRDMDSLNFFQEIGIESFLSSCVALLQNPNVGRENFANIYTVDLTDEVKSLLPKNVAAKAIPLHHNMDSGDKHDTMQRYTNDLRLLEMYSKAKLVITQCIHCVLPCVGMGIPVLFINSPKMPGGGESSRMTEVTDLFHTLDLYHVDQSTAVTYLWNFNYTNPPQNPNVAKFMKLRATFWNAIRQHQDLVDSAYKLGIVPLPPPRRGPDHKEMLFHLIFTTSGKDSIRLLGDLPDGKWTSGQWNWRHWRTLESVLYHHPYAQVIIHSNVLKQSLFDVLTESGYNVKVKNFDLVEMAKHSPAKLFDSRKIKQSESGPFWYSHATDLLRLLFLYLDGGVYLDTDVILVKPFETLTENSLGWQDPGQAINGAVMKFDKGHPFLAECLREFATTYKSSSWAGNGPGLLTRVFLKWSDRKNKVTVLDKNYFYMIHWSQMLKRCFSQTAEDVLDSMMNVVEKTAFAVHLNSKITGGGQAQPGSFCHYLFNEFCVLCSEVH